MKIFFSIYNNLLLLLFLIRNNLFISQINDNYESGVLEEGNYELLEVTDYHNLNIIVSTSKNIYSGIPPTKKVETNSNLINVTSLITINENYLLAACLQDSLLGKINLLTGNFISLLSYSDINIFPELEIPKYLCSLSNIDNIIFICHSRIGYIDGEVEIKNITIIKLSIVNKESIDEGPSIDDSFELKSYIFSLSNGIASSVRQISCEPLRILEEPEGYRLICLYTTNSTINTYDVFASTINSDFDGFENWIKVSTIQSEDKELGFKIFRENDTYARCMTSNN